MKYFLFILLPILAFSQTVSFPDSIETSSGENYPCEIVNLSEQVIIIIYGDNNKETLGLNGLNKIILSEKGEIFNREDGLIYHPNYINRLLAKRDASYTTGIESPKIEHRYRPGDHELLLMPTAITMNKGSAYISSYELFFLNFSAAVTSRTHIGFFSLFPISGEFVETISLGVKQNYMRYEKIEGAVWGSYTFKNKFLMVGNVFTYKWPKGGFSLGIGGVDALNDETEMKFIFQGGVSFDTGTSSSIMFEYTNGGTLIDDNDFNGFISLGIRFRGEKLAWDLAGFRPLIDNDNSELFLFPLIKATYKFGN